MKQVQIMFTAVQNGGKSNGLLLAQTEICHQIFGGWELKTMKNLQKTCDLYEDVYFIFKMFTNGLNIGLPLQVWVES